MMLLDEISGLYTDHYELTMAQGYFLNGRKDEPACFDYFFRKNPFGGGYVVFAGLDDLLSLLKGLQFSQSDIDYLAQINFNKAFLDYLSGFSFGGTIHAPREGEVVFPNEPVIRVEGNIIETQVIETLLLNIINFESLIATKASRLRIAAGDKSVIDFGLRRAQGLGGIHASKAAVMGGCNSTSNVISAKLFNLVSTGTQAHSWIQSYDDEITAFRAFAKAFPKKCVLLVDTYDTLKQGVPNAIEVAKEMEEKGDKLFGIRLDSGDLAYLSKQARKMLDDAGLDYVKIIASNQLDEFVIQSLDRQKAPVDGFGVGTKLVTGKDDAALDGVYKLAMNNNVGRLKISETREKITLPGIKNIYRYLDEKEKFYADGIFLEEEGDVTHIYHQFEPDKSSDVFGFKKEVLLQKVMEDGQRTWTAPSPAEVSQYAHKRIKQLPEEHWRFTNPHFYKVGISKKLLDYRGEIINHIKEKYQKYESITYR